MTSEHVTTMYMNDVTTLMAQMSSPENGAKEKNDNDNAILIGVSVSAILIIGIVILAICIVLTRFTRSSVGKCQKRGSQ